MTDIENFRKEELTVDPVKANLQAIVYFIPFALIFGVTYFICWRSAFTKKGLKNAIQGFNTWNIPLILGLIVAGIVIHELIHGATWACFSKKGYKSIRYGVMWKYLTPYCHCNEPLLIKHYIAGALMPGIVLGIMPSIISVITGHLGLFAFGMLFTLAAGGDFMIVNLLRKEPMNNLVQDHPSKIGCYIYRPDEAL